MHHIEEYDADYIHEIESPKLYTQVKSLNIPFHKWYGWLDSRFKFLAEAHKQQQEKLLKEQLLQIEKQKE